MSCDRPCLELQNASFSFDIDCFLVKLWPPESCLNYTFYGESVVLLMVELSTSEWVVWLFSHLLDSWGSVVHSVGCWWWSSHWTSDKNTVDLRNSEYCRVQSVTLSLTKRFVVCAFCAVLPLAWLKMFKIIIVMVELSTSDWVVWLFSHLLDSWGSVVHSVGCWWWSTHWTSIQST